MGGGLQMGGLPDIGSARFLFLRIAWLLPRYTGLFNAMTYRYGDLVRMGVMVPTGVKLIAPQDGASIVGLLLTTNATVSELNQ